jgi:hypothetical protein
MFMSMSVFSGAGQPARVVVADEAMAGYTGDPA